MDLSQLSDEDLAALASGDMGKMSDEGLAQITNPKITSDNVFEVAKDFAPKSGYEGVPDNQLAWYQKGEKMLEKVGLVKPGEEVFSPGHNANSMKPYALMVQPQIAAQVAGAALPAAAGAAASMGNGILEGIKSQLPNVKKGAGYAIGAIGAGGLAAIGRKLFGSEGH